MKRENIHDKSKRTPTSFHFSCVAVSRLTHSGILKHLAARAEMACTNLLLRSFSATGGNRYRIGMLVFTVWNLRRGRERLSCSPHNINKKSTMQYNHPARKLGAWLQARRKAAGLVMSEMAGMLRIGLAKYSEIENGIGDWLTPDHEQKLGKLLSLDSDENRHFKTLVENSRKGSKLKFADVFTREQLAPVRLRHLDGKNITAQEREEILDSVFLETV